MLDSTEHLGMTWEHVLISIIFESVRLTLGRWTPDLKATLDWLYAVECPNH